MSETEFHENIISPFESVLKKLSKKTPIVLAKFFNETGYNASVLLTH